MKETDYRKNVGIMLLDDNQKILAGEAYHYPGEWLMPQGGMELNETVEQTLWRELMEETGISQANTELLSCYPNWLYYKMRKPLIDSGKTFLGQKQKWFLLKYNGPLPDVNDVIEKEFVQFNRVTPSWLLTHSAKVKVPIYEQIFEYFL